MINYILKMTICSGLLYLIFILFLEKEKMHRFNRAYLLFSIAFSFVVPLIVIKTISPVMPVSEIINENFESFNNIIFQQTSSPVNKTDYLPIFLWGFYISITDFFLYRFLKNMFAVFSKIKTVHSIPYFNAKLVLTNDHLIPHSFLKYIFIDKKDFEKKAIEKEILTHELAHVKQKHTIDILLIELLLIFAWFNPFLYLYKKSIKLNHEFLADESVVKVFSDMQAYQHLLLSKIYQTNSLLLSSPFNYLITKKRLIMMAKSTSVKVAFVKKITLIPLFALTTFDFSRTAIAQDTSKIITHEKIQNDSVPNAIVGLSSGSTKNGVSQELLSEYQNVIDKYKTAKNFSWLYFSKNITAADRSRMENIYIQMSKEQQKAQPVVFIKRLPPFQKLIPTKSQMESFKNSKIYGVWINEKRVNNAILNNYTNEDFAHVFVSKLNKNAINYGNHYYQVDLMTKDFYQKYFDEEIANKDKYLMSFQSFKKIQDSK